MSPAAHAGGAPDRGDAAPALAPADRLALAAAPTFAAMALMTHLFGEGPAALLCGDAFPLGGMVPMYLLMSAFHLSPWLRFFAGRRRG